MFVVPMLWDVAETVKDLFQEQVGLVGNDGTSVGWFDDVLFREIGRILD